MHPTHILKNAISVRWPERPDYEEDPAPDTTGGRLLRSICYFLPPTPAFHYEKAR